MLGTGASGAPRGGVAEAIDAIGRVSAPIVACDVPSGVDATTGEVPGPAVTADLTVTFQRSNLGLHVAPGAAHAGAVEVVEIGVPRGCPVTPDTGLIAERLLDLYPRRQRYGTKFDSGVVVVAGGARGLGGAPVLAALAAQRAGAGYVQVAVPADIEQAVAQRLLEAMAHGLPAEDGTHGPGGVEALLSLAERAGALVLGPGLGRTTAAAEFARET